MTSHLARGSARTAHRPLEADLAAGSQAALAQMKAAINAVTLGRPAPVLQSEADAQGTPLVAADFARGVTAFRARRRPGP